MCLFKFVRACARFYWVIVDGRRRPLSLGRYSENGLSADALTKHFQAALKTTSRSRPFLERGDSKPPHKAACREFKTPELKRLATPMVSQD